MKIKINGIVLGFAAIGVSAAAYVGYRVVKEAAKKEEEFKKEKSDALMYCNGDEGPKTATLENPCFVTSKEKSDAFKVLSRKYHDIKNANNREELAAAVGSYNDIWNYLMDPDKSNDEKMALVIFECGIIEKEEKKISEAADRVHKKDLEREKCLAEIEKAKILAKSLDKVAARTMNRRTGLESIVKDAEELIVKMK